MLQHQSHSRLTQRARSILRKLAAAQPGSDEYQPEHAPTHSCAKLRADVQLQVAKPFFFLRKLTGRIMVLNSQISH